MPVKKSLLTILFLLSLLQLNAQEKENKMNWFADAKLGIFIHWGIYSVNGISESWSFFNNYISYPNYKSQLSGFTASKYNPEEWVKLIEESGAKYAVITSKHHDGVALWNSKAKDALTIPQSGAAKKDVLTPLVMALKKSGLKTGIYFSLPDWSYENYDVFTREHKRYDIKKEPAKWASFLKYQQTQLKELAENYNPDLYWFDGDWEHSAEEWQAPTIKNILTEKNKNVIFNSRLANYGDYETPEQGIPVLKPKSPYWELCYTMNDSWGYQPYDTHYKSANMIIRTLVDCISMGGNLLLDIGPKADGTIAPEQQEILKRLGKWTNKHAEAIYGTVAGIDGDHINGKTAQSKDGKTLYLYVDYKSKNGFVLKGIESVVKYMEVVGYSGKIRYKKTGEGDYLIEIPDAANDPDVTVIAVHFNERLKLNFPKKNTIAPESLLADKTLNSAQKISAVINQVAENNNPLDRLKLNADGSQFQLKNPGTDQISYQWILKNAEALSNTQNGIPEGHFQGKTFLSADKQNLYLVVEGRPNGPIALKGLKNKINRIRIVGEGTILPYEIYNKLYWSKIPGIVYIPIPPDRLDPNFTIINVLLDGKIDLYREHVGVLDQNN